MLAYQAQTYDDILSGASTVAYTDTRFDRLSGSTEGRSHQIVATLVSGTPRLTAQVEHSSDGRTWFPRAGTPEVSNVGISAGAPNVFYISADDGRVATGPMVRFKLSLDAGGGAVQVRVYTVGRTRRPGKPGPIAPGEQCGCEQPKAAGSGGGAGGAPQVPPTATIAKAMPSAAAQTPRRRSGAMPGPR